MGSSGTNTVVTVPVAVRGAERDVGIGSVVELRIGGHLYRFDKNLREGLRMDDLPASLQVLLFELVNSLDSIDG